ncbi:MauE/DoxX family redox-associated membrane protein [Corynebacterium lactis]|uniref:Membrane protein n=1 Tax=Corynebacterium lactis RW2-5 TaxID=1408189 RepID=A0A0K2GYL0_9CORY|nr:MauE/DoxX family redox-associated membrane protein [Corynebacterium lactis]ALA66874.1 membrane protein [Corynebacterium lactis RW2-5]
MKDVLGAIARFGLAIVWLVSGGIKLMDPLASRQAVQAFEIIPRDYLQAVSVGLPALEVILGLLLLFGIFLRPTAIVSGVLMGIFIAAIISVWARGLQIDCGCFGGGGYNPEVGPATYLTEIARDAGFLLLAVIVYWRPFRRLAIAP